MAGQQQSTAGRGIGDQRILGALVADALTSVGTLTVNTGITTSITPAAFAANTSGIADDSATFGGYTLGQVVAALKQVGILT